MNIPYSQCADWYSLDGSKEKHKPILQWLLVSAEKNMHYSSGNIVHHWNHKQRLWQDKWHLPARLKSILKEFDLLFYRSIEELSHMLKQQNNLSENKPKQNVSSACQSDIIHIYEKFSYRCISTAINTAYISTILIKVPLQGTPEYPIIILLNEAKSQKVMQNQKIKTYVCTQKTD